MTGSQQLTDALTQLQRALTLAQFPLPLPEADDNRHRAAALSGQVRDYLLPRAASLDAPLLAVVGGSTGAGKSTLVNSLVRAEITKPGVLRPTTRAPVLIANPDDMEWFRGGQVLPELVRSDKPVLHSRALQLVPFVGMPKGLALLDAPDIDSVDDANRALARQLLAAADLWVFVTSGARYADAVAWTMLEDAAARNAVIAVVLNRCPPDSVQDLSNHLSKMLADRGVPVAKLFAIAEQPETDAVRIPDPAVAPIRTWLGSLTAESERRSAVAAQTLAGTVRTLKPEVTKLARATQDQVDAIADLQQIATSRFRDAGAELAAATSDGSLLRGEVLSRWQEFVGTGDFMRAVEQRISAWRDRITAWFTGEEKAKEVQVAISDGLSALVVEQTERACEQVANSWSLTPWGREIVAAQPDLQRATPGFEVDAERVVRMWQTDLMKMIEEEGRGRRVKARFLALGTNAIGAALMVVVFAFTGGLSTAEIGIAGGTSVLAQRLLEGVFGEDAVRALAKSAKEQLDERITVLISGQLMRYQQILDQLAINPETPQHLAMAARELGTASTAAFEDLTRPTETGLD